MDKCKICNNETTGIVNISFKAIPLCHKCSCSIAIQTVVYHLSGDFSFDVDKMIREQKTSEDKNGN